MSKRRLARSPNSLLAIFQSRSRAESMIDPSPAAGFKILAREDFSDVTYSLVIHHPLMAKAAQPGQFVIVMSHESGERIPLPIADFDRKKGTVTLVVQGGGKAAKEVRQTFQAG